MSHFSPAIARSLCAALVLCAGLQRAQANKSQAPAIPLPGYAAVPVRYSFLNKMLMDARVNGRKARFIVDTGASFSVIDAERARALRIAPVGPDSPYGQTMTLNGETYRIGYIENLKAGSMDFGGGPIALFAPSSGFGLRSRLSGEDADGILGADILTRYKAVINCFTKTLFFKVDPAAHLRLARFAASQGFVRVPLREEVSRGFTVPAKVNGHPCRLLVDTGGFITTFDDGKARAFGVAFKETRVTASFSDNVPRRVSLGWFNDLRIGDFRVPPQKLAAVPLPQFALEHGGEERVAGILGMELLALSHGIIDFDSMSLFLK